MTNPYLSGTDNKSSSPAKLAILLAVAWLLIGALFKLYKGAPHRPAADGAGVVAI